MTDNPDNPDNPNVWFCYERDFARRWQPRVYYDIPSTRGMDGTIKVARSELIQLRLNEVLYNHPDNYKAISIKELAAKYPPPNECKECAL